jgi:DNA-binding transcriptional MocR family regulator
MKFFESELTRSDPRLPLSRQIAAILRLRIEELAIQDARLPTERQLAQMFAVSRVTVRRALAHLQHAGLIQRQVGRGTFCGPHSSGAIGGGYGANSIGLVRRVREPWPESGCLLNRAFEGSPQDLCAKAAKKNNA